MVATFLRTRKKIIGVICGLLWMVGLWSSGFAVAQGVPSQGPNVHGVWFAAGDRQRPCSINQNTGQNTGQNNGTLSLIDEKGQVSGGRIVGPDLIEAYGVLGRVSEDGQRIDWGFGLSWMRNPTHQQQEAVSNAIDISGRWYAQGNSRHRCRITQSGEVIQTIDETGRVWPGKIIGQSIEGIAKKGFLTMSGTRIDWSDNTFWSRHPQKNSKQAVAAEKPAPPAPAVSEPVTPQPATTMFQPSFPPQPAGSPGQTPPTPQPSPAESAPPAPPQPPSPVQAAAPPAPQAAAVQPSGFPVPPPAPSQTIHQIWPHLKGSWFAYGDPSRICTIEQHGQDLVFINEAGNRSTGRLLDGHTVESNGFRGVISQDFSRIEWANHTWWVR